MNLLGPSWRTTLSGVLTILAVIGHVAEAILAGKPIDWTVTIAGITSGVGLLTARDNKVSSEAAGVVTTPK